jgi:hypothetical protein
MRGLRPRLRNANNAKIATGLAAEQARQASIAAAGDAPQCRRQRGVLTIGVKIERTTGTVKFSMRRRATALSCSMTSRGLLPCGQWKSGGRIRLAMTNRHCRWPAKNIVGYPR